MCGVTWSASMLLWKIQHSWAGRLLWVQHGWNRLPYGHDTHSQSRTWSRNLISPCYTVCMHEWVILIVAVDKCCLHWLSGLQNQTATYPDGIMPSRGLQVSARTAGPSIDQAWNDAEMSLIRSGHSARMSQSRCRYRSSSAHATQVLHADRQWTWNVQQRGSTPHSKFVFIIQHNWSRLVDFMILLGCISIKWSHSA